jgi:hypothetical protein
MSASSTQNTSAASLIGTPHRGRRRGDAILIAFNHALDQGDAEVALQLLVEYKKLNLDSPFELTLERRRTNEQHDSVFQYLWRRLRGGFISALVAEKV